MGWKKMLLHPDEWRAIWREQTYPCMIPQVVVDYLKVILDPLFPTNEAVSDEEPATLLVRSNWMLNSVKLINAARYCQDIAAQSTNPTIIKIYTKKAADYLANHFELLPDTRSFFGINSDTTSLANIAWKAAHSEFANVEFYLKAIKTFEAAIQFAANSQEKKEYLSIIARLKKRVLELPQQDAVRIPGRFANIIRFPSLPNFPH